VSTIDDRGGQPAGRRALIAWARRLSFALPAVVLFSAASPAIAQRTPGGFFPALALVGGALLVLSLVRAVREWRHGARRPGLGLLVLANATVLFAVLPLTRLAYMLAPAAAGAPRILAGFGDWRGAEGYPLLRPHRGIDIKGRVGDDVLAAAEGRITVARDTGDLCGLIAVVVHDPHGYRTIYCHLPALAVRAGDSVARGQRLGALGTTGQRAWPGYEHVHLELQRGQNPDDLHDPLARIAGCFDDKTAYPADRLTLTYPVRC
jgi:murein DD-endopeptidase MepM/ murein hydrolase activator NlpD